MENRLTTSMIASGRLLLSTCLIAILVMSTILVAIPAVPRTSAQAQQLSRAEKNWEYIDHNSLGTSFNPQTQITKDNVQFLELKWLFPFPAALTGVGGYPVNAIGSQGSTATPLVIDGIMYIVTNGGQIFAVSISNGKTIWTHTMELDAKEAEARNLPIEPLGNFGQIVPHLHGILFFENKLIFPAPPCDLHIVDATTGKLIRKIKSMCAEPIEGYQRFGRGGYKGVQSYPGTVYEKGRILVTMGGTTADNNAGGRGFFSGYNIDTGELLWRTFLQPPTGGDPEWSLRFRDKGFIQGIPANKIPAEALRGDWGEAKWVAAGPGWGQYAIDEETGIAYVGTTQPGAYANGTLRPGPNLFSASVLALDTRNGEIKWFHQTTAHDIWDWDCSWNSVLSKARVGGQEKKVLYKGCKNGLVFALDAATGEAIWIFDPTAPPPSGVQGNILGPDLGFPGKVVRDNFLKRCQGCYLLDPRDKVQMGKPWQEYPSKGPAFQNPPNSGSIESDIALGYGKVYVGVYNKWWYRQVTNCDGHPRPISSCRTELPAPETRTQNTTIYALDQSTGEIKWKFFVPEAGFRGGVTVTGGMVFVPSTDTNLYTLDAETGKVLWKRPFGVTLAVHTVIAADASGKIKIIQNFGGQFSLWGQNVPGAIAAFGLPDKLPEPQVVTKEIVMKAPKEVIREAAKELGVVQTVETISPISYAIVGVGVIMLVVAGVIFSRRKKI